MLSRKNRLWILKLFSLFSVVRGYNIVVIILAQYLSSIFILAPDRTLREVVFDLNLLVLVLASAGVIAAGYIINSFYDGEKDLINRPQKTLLDRLVSQRTKLTSYCLLNFLSAVLASYVSFITVIFFSSYIFGIWFYSHKLKKMPIIGNVIASLLAITPFFAVFVYYKNFDSVIFVHATFLFLMIAMRELVKDLENLKGDLAQGYRTIPIVYGTLMSKRLLTIFAVVSMIPAYLLLAQFSIGHMCFFFYGVTALLLLFVFLLWRSTKRSHYLILHNILKFIIVSGVFGILLIDVQVVLSRLL